MDKEYVEKHTIFETITGSRSYGIHSPDSDCDKQGIMIPGLEYYVGNKNVEQFKEEGTDRTIFEFKKVVGLITENNPNCLDLLFAPQRCIIKNTPYWEQIMKNSDLFISKKARYTFSCYAINQLKRIETHRGYLLNPPKGKPKRSDFGLGEFPIFESAQLKAILNIESLFEYVLNEDRTTFINELDTVYAENVIPVFKKYLKKDRQEICLAYVQGTLHSQLNTFTILGKCGYIKDEFLEEAEKELKYQTKVNEWKQYEKWKKTRNEKRAELERKFGYDCYSNDTEFLTENGWKLYENITSNDKLATVFCGNYQHRKQFIMEYQNYIDKFEGNFTGEMYNLFGDHLDVLVTPNHRLLYIKKERKSGKKSDVILNEISLVPDTFEILVAPSPINKVFEYNVFKELPIKNTQYLTLMGWYLSDGSMHMVKNLPKSIVISQKKGGKLHWSMSRFEGEMKGKIRCKLYSHKRKPNCFNPNKIIEMMLIVSDDYLKNRILNECGITEAKRIPRYIFKLSKRLKIILLNALIGGDGTIRKTSFKSIIYYSTLKNLADDVQELAMSCGFETSLYGPYHQTKEVEDHVYECDMYQVHINKNKNQFKTCIRSKNIKKIKVENQKIVCFTVPNGTLITRRNGHIGIHGNSKHGAHLVRLLRMGSEILSTGKVNVDRTEIDAEELKAIRHDGIWTYDQIKEYAINMDLKLGELFKESKLQEGPQRDKIDILTFETIKKYFNI